MRRAFTVLAVLCLGVAAMLARPGPAAAQGGGERRVALVIGNGAYQSAGRLPNAAGDALAVAAVLRTLRFEVVALTDQTRSGFEEALIAFARRAAGADIALFFYSGHGMQANGTSVLLPVDVRAQSAEELRLRAIDAAQVLAMMQGARVRIALLDACRDNPLAGQLATRARGVTRGLARIDASDVGTLVAYATAEGRTADDGDGPNSPFTAALLRHLPTAGIELQQALTRVTQSVRAATGQQQVPWVSSSLAAEVYLAGAPGAGGPAIGSDPPAAPVDREALFWQSIQASRDPADFTAYLARWPDGAFAVLARNRLSALRPADARPADAAPAEAGPADAGPASGAARGVPPTTILGIYPQPGTEFRDRRADGSPCPACPAMVIVPAGRFIMGVPAAEEEREGVPPDRRGRAQPPVEITVRQAFALGRSHVTRREFAAFVRATGAAGGSLPSGRAQGGCTVLRPGGPGAPWEQRPDPAASYAAPGFDQGDDHPAVCVSWLDARAFTQWLSDQTGQPYRLPSEAEWEYAARAGTRTARWWGDDAAAACAHANVADRSGAQRFGWPLAPQVTHPCSDGFAATAPVERFGANAFGLHDMLGNAWQWVEDCWSDSYRGRPDDARPWPAGTCTTRVARGGSWLADPWYVRSGYRGAIPAATRGSGTGFRVARAIAP